MTEETAVRVAEALERIAAGIEEVSSFLDTVTQQLETRQGVSVAGCLDFIGDQIERLGDK